MAQSQGSISAFRSAMQQSKGFARASKFEVVITPPSNLKLSNNSYYANGQIVYAGPAGNTSAVQVETGNEGIKSAWNALQDMKDVGTSLTLLCDTISLPGHDLQTHGVQYASEPKIEVVQTHGFAQKIAATFYLSTDLRERHFFEQWQNLAVNRETHKANYYDDYIGSMEIYQLSSDGIKEIRTYGVKVYDIYPSTLAGIEYSFESSNQIVKQTVSFDFKEWKNLGDKDLNLRPY